MAVASATAMDITTFTESGELIWSAPVGEAVEEYRVEWTSNLTSKAWIDAGFSVAPSGSVLTAQVDSDKDQRFFRVKALVPDYLVVDLSGGPGAENFPISYLSDVPPGGWTDEYRLRFRGVDPARRYRVTTEPDGMIRTLDGHALCDAGLPLRLDTPLTSCLLLCEATG